MATLFARLTRLSRAILRCELALVTCLSVMLVGVAVPGSFLVELDEASWPAETEDETQERLEEEAAQGPRRFEVLRHSAAASGRPLIRQCSVSLIRPLLPGVKAGHRLPNGLLAPPRC